MVERMTWPNKNMSDDHHHGIPPHHPGRMADHYERSQRADLAALERGLCPRCNGPAAFTGPEWSCITCGWYFDPYTPEQLEAMRARGREHDAFHRSRGYKPEGRRRARLR